MTLIATSIILAMASIGTIGHGLVIGNSQPFISRRIVSKRYRSSSMHMYIDHDSMPITSILDMASLSSATSTATSTTTLSLSNIFHTASSSLTSSSDPQELEVDLLNDVSFVALDIPEFLSHNTAWLRLGNVIGRLLILSSDYIQSDQISPDEWVLHLSMLAISTHIFCVALDR